MKVVAVFMGLDSAKWRVLSPNTLKFTQKGVTSMYHALTAFAEKSEDVVEMMADLTTPIQEHFYPGMISKLDHLLSPAPLKPETR